MRRNRTNRPTPQTKRTRPSRAQASTPAQEAGLRSHGSGPALLRNSRQPIVGLCAEFRPEHYSYARTQSRTLQRLEWEDRAPPLRSWGLNFVADLALRYFG